MQEGAVAYIDSFVCSNTFEAVRTSVNQSLYLQWTSGSTVVSATATIPAADYDVDTLVVAVQAAIAAHTPWSAGNVTVTKSGDTRLAFACGGLSGSSNGFRIWSRDQLRRGEGPTVSQPLTHDWQDACEVVGCLTGSFFANASAPATGSIISLQPYRQLFLHSSSLGEASSYGPNGESTIIASVLVGNTVVGDLITSFNQGLMASAVQCPSVLCSLHFQLKDSNGKVIDCEGHDIGFTLVTENN
jgi:hypothetical protein